MKERTYYAVVRPSGYVPSNGFGVTPVFVERERAEALSGHDARHVKPVHIIPAADHARLTRIADAARTLLEGSDEPARDPDGEYRKVRLCDWDALDALITPTPTERPTEREMK